MAHQSVLLTATRSVPGAGKGSRPNGSARVAETLKFAGLVSEYEITKVPFSTGLKLMMTRGSPFGLTASFLGAPYVGSE
jgi:hypothetical protein